MVFDHKSPDPPPEIQLDFWRGRTGGGVPVVLVAEDDPVLLKVIVGGLLRLGFQAFGARDGREAQRLLIARRPDLVITDIVMPDVDGIELIRRIRALAPATPVIAMTGGGQYGRAQTYLNWAGQLGADGVLRKPFDLGELVLLIRRSLAFGARPSPSQSTQ